ncbi:MAG TPA: hypothetical protein VL173_12555 [Vicinamibacterales bacterium]|nr:hypothetical protein [Vicinamibacterales bacterium]
MVTTFKRRIDVKVASLFRGGPIFGKEQTRLSLGQINHIADVVPLEANTVDLLRELLREAHLHSW